MDLRFRIVFAELNEAFWRRTDTLVAGLQILTGGLSVFGAFNSDPELFRIAGFTLAVVGSSQLWLRPGERSVDYRDVRRLLQAVDQRAWSLSLQDLDAETSKIVSASTRRGWKIFTRVAENAVLRRHGYPEKTSELSVFERVAELVV